MKKIVLLIASALLISVMSSCYKQTVCATYTKTTEKTVAEKNSDNL